MPQPYQDFPNLPAPHREKPVLIYELTCPEHSNCRVHIRETTSFDCEEHHGSGSPYVNINEQFYSGGIGTYIQAWDPSRVAQVRPQSRQSEIEGARIAISDMQRMQRAQDELIRRSTEVLRTNVAPGRRATRIQINNDDDEVPF